MSSFCYTQCTYLRIPSDAFSIGHFSAATSEAGIRIVERHTCTIPGEDYPEGMMFVAKVDLWPSPALPHATETFSWLAGLLVPPPNATYARFMLVGERGMVRARK